MVILVEGEEELRRVLGVLEEWCSEMKVNADKCSVMHIRRNDVKRTTSIFSVSGERVKVVESYKYLNPETLVKKTLTNHPSPFPAIFVPQQ